VSKRTITRWYIGAWLVWVVSLGALFVTAHYSQETFDRSYLTVVMFVSGAITVYMWLRALLKLAHRHATFSFVSILLLQLVGLGIVGMVAYAISGPDDRFDIAVRPSTT
jgi:hypothetical protein